MKDFFAVVGWFHTILFVLGSLGAVDYHVCIKGPGGCAPNKVMEGTK